MAEIIPIDASKLELPAFVDRAKVVAAEVDGKKSFRINQELPAHLRRENVRRFVPKMRAVSKNQLAEARMGTRVLAEKAHVDREEIIEIPALDGERIFFRVVQPGWFSCRHVDVNGRRRVAIDSGKGAAVLVPEHDLYQAFRTVKRG